LPAASALVGVVDSPYSSRAARLVPANRDNVGMGRGRGRRALAAIALILAGLAPACSRPHAPVPTPPDAAWVRREVAGLPGDAQVWRMVHGRRAWVAIGSVPLYAAAGDAYDVALWSSSDGLVWREAHRLRGAQRAGLERHAGLVVTTDGFAAAGTICPPQRCEPFALRSTDGRKWRSVTIPPVPGGADSAANSGVVDVAAPGPGPGRVLVAVGSTGFVGSASGGPALWRSEDGGRSWLAVPASALQDAAAVGSLDRIVVAGPAVLTHGRGNAVPAPSGDRLWRSDDGGLHWSPVALPAGAGNEPFGLTPAGPAVLLTGWRAPAEPGLWRSDDLAHWAGPSSVPATHGTLVATAAGMVFAHTDSYPTAGRLRLWGSAGGGPFQRVYDSGPLDGPSVQDVVEADRRVVVFASVGRGGLRRFLRFEADERCAVTACPGNDGGVGSDGGPDIIGSRPDPVPLLFGRDRLLVADGHGGYADVTPARVEESADETVEDALFLDHDHGFAVVVNVEALAAWVLRTADAGQTWVTTAYRGGYSLHAGTSLRLSATDPDHAWTVFTVPPSGSAGGIARTEDGGDTWSDAGEMPVSGPLRFIDGRRGFVAAEGGWGGHAFYTTIDGGATWAQPALALPAGVAADQVTFDPPRFFGPRGILPVRVGYPSPSRVAFYVTADTGGTWTAAGLVDLPPGTAAGPVAVAAPDVWWVADTAGIFVATTSDGGRTWARRQPTGADGGFDLVDARDATTAIALHRGANGGRVLVTHDGGASFAPLPLPGAAPPRPGTAAPCPSLGPARLPDRVVDRQVVRADVDGDGRADRFVLYTVPSGRTVVDHQTGRPVDPEPDRRIRIELAAGPVIDVSLSSRPAALAHFGAIDFDGDGRQEVFTRSGDRNFGGLTVFAFRDCRMATVFGDFGDADTLYYQQPEGGLPKGIECTDVDGDGRPEIVATSTGPEPDRWSYTAYHYAGASARIVSSDHSGTPPSRPRPAGLRFAPGFTCPGVDIGI